MARKPRIIQTEYPYHLVCRTNNRTFRFRRKQITRIVFTTLSEGAEKYNVLLHHVVLMANHYHIVATATETNIHRFMQYVNSRIAVRYNRTVGRTGHLWGDRYRSCIIATDDHYLAVVRYIYRNPSRADVVKDLADFAPSSLQFYAFGKKVDLLLTDDHLVLNLGRDRKRVAAYFQILVLDENAPFPPDSHIQAALRRMFYGPADFVQHMADTHLA